MNCSHRLSNDEAFKRLSDALKRDGARLTEPRKILLEAALKSEKPFSAEGLQQLVNVGPGSSKPDLATIYRNLSYFNEIGLISRVDLGGETAVYEVGSKDQGHHHHYFICRACGKTETLEACSLAPTESILKKRGYHGLSHRLEFSGLCPDC
jgi:Fur family zinc uptake transcriptional regulator